MTINDQEVATVLLKKAFHASAAPGSYQKLPIGIQLAAVDAWSDGFWLWIARRVSNSKSVFLGIKLGAT